MIPAGQILNLIDIPDMILCPLLHDHLRSGNLSFIGNNRLLQILIQIRFTDKI